MKHLTRVIALIAVFALVCSCALAEYAGPAFDELLSLRQEVDRLLITAEGFEKLTLSQGTFTVGVDLPAGAYSLKGTILTALAVYSGEPLDESTKLVDYTLAQEDEIERIELQDGFIVLVTGSQLELSVLESGIEPSPMSYDDLIAQRDALTDMLTGRDDYQQLKLNKGTYVVGEDIAAGTYCTGNSLMCVVAIYTGDVSDENNLTIMYTIAGNAPIEKFTLAEGQTVIIDIQSPFPMPLEVSTYIGLDI